MAPNPNQPTPDGENYSVDEMMARLKRNERQKRSANPANDGELITRPDGSQVVRVRKRKRRSKQPEKKTAKPTDPRLKWIILGSLAGLFLILLVSTVFIITKYNGRSFKEKTESTVSSLTGAHTTQLTQLRVTPVSAKANKAELTWDQHAFFHSATFSGIRADIKATSFFSNDWIGEEVVAATGKIIMQTPATTVEMDNDTSPSPYQYRSFRCDDLDIRFGSDRRAPAITGLQASLRKQVDEHYQLVFNDGLMQIPNWPELNITSGIIRLQPGYAEIETRLAATNGRKGELLIEGRIAKNTANPAVLDVKAKNYPIQQLLGKDLGRLIQGEIQSDLGTLSYNYGKETKDALSFILPFNSTELHLREFPMFTDLKEVTKGDTQYIRPVLTHCRGTIIRTSEGVTLNNLDLVSSRVLSLKGHITVTPQGALSGELMVGIPSRVFGRDETPPAIFSEPHSGFIYTKVTLGGSVHNPHDNLNELLRNSRKSSTTKPVATPTPSTLTPAIPADSTEEYKRKKQQEFEDLLR